MPTKADLLWRKKRAVRLIHQPDRLDIRLPQLPILRTQYSALSTHDS